MDRGLKRPLIVSAVIAFGVSAIGGAATQIGPWYRALEKPVYNPPDWVFAPAWTLIYGLCVYAAALVWRDGDARARALLVTLFALNIVLNIMWSVLFFALKRPDWALFEIGVFWLSILALVIFAGRVNGRARLALLPYLLWVTFASVLNRAIVSLNAPFIVT